MGASSLPARGLARGAVGPARVITFGVSNVAPAGAVVAGLIIMVSYAGFASPLVVVIAFAASLCCAVSIAEFARRLPSAGSLYTYNSRGLGRTGGFLTGWMMIFAYALYVPGFTVRPSPLGYLTSRYWSPSALWVIDLVVVLTGLGFVIAVFNAAIRVLFAMGRERALPGSLDRLSRRQTPVVAIGGVAVLTLLLGLPLTYGVGGGRTFSYLAGAAGLSLVLIYLAVNVAVVRAFRTEFRDEFRPGRHLLIPAAAAVLFLFPLWGILHPRTHRLMDLLPFAALGWLGLGIAAAAILRARHPASFEALGRVFAPAEQ